MVNWNEKQFSMYKNALTVHIISLNRLWMVKTVHLSLDSAPLNKGYYLDPATSLFSRDITF